MEPLVRNPASQNARTGKIMTEITTQPGPAADRPAPGVTLAEPDRRPARIEELITAATAASAQREAGAPERDAGSNLP